MRGIAAAWMAGMVLAGCNPQTASQIAPATPKAPPEVTFRDLTEAEKKLLHAKLAESLKDPSSAQFRWAKFGQPVDASLSTVTYCAEVNAKNSYGGYTGKSPFLAVITLKDRKIIGGALAASGSSAQDRQIIEKMCRDDGMNPYS